MRFNFINMPLKCGRKRILWDGDGKISTQPWRSLGDSEPITLSQSDLFHTVVVNEDKVRCRAKQESLKSLEEWQDAIHSFLFLKGKKPQNPLDSDDQMQG